LFVRARLKEKEEEMKTYLRKGWSLIIALAIMTAMMVMATNAQAAEYWKAKYEKFSATAGETLATGDVVCILATNSYAYKAGADASTLRPAVGVVGKGGASGAVVEIVTRGILAGPMPACFFRRLVALPHPDWMCDLGCRQYHGDGVGCSRSPDLRDDRDEEERTGGPIRRYVDLCEPVPPSG
jgi:hypothetical protein